jgi:hypothetical protein
LRCLGERAPPVLELRDGSRGPGTFVRTGEALAEAQSIASSLGSRRCGPIRRLALGSG